MQQLLSSLAAGGVGEGLQGCHRDKMEGSFALSQGGLGLRLKV